jgi:hypothetical protein
VQGLSTDIQKKLLLSIGSHRDIRLLTPVEVGEAVQTSVNAGTTMQEVAEFLHLEGTSVLTKFVRLLRLSPDVRHLVDWGRSDATIGFTAASEVARLDDPADQLQLCQAGLRNRLGSSEMKQILQLHKRSGQSISDCIEEILKLRPRTAQIHVLIGGITEPALSARLAAVSQAERDKWLHQAVTKSFPALARYGGRLGPNRFTITGDKAVSAELTKDGKDFEAVINHALAETVSQ